MRCCYRRLARASLVLRGLTSVDHDQCAATRNLEGYRLSLPWRQIALSWATSLRTSLTRAEVRGTTVYASAKLPSSETSKVFRLVKHRRCLPGTHRRCFR